MANDLALQLSYALAKQVPDMERGFRIETNYGAIEICEEDALAFSALTQRILTKRLAALTREAKHDD